MQDQHTRRTTLKPPAKAPPAAGQHTSDDNKKRPADDGPATIPNSTSADHIITASAATAVASDPMKRVGIVLRFRNDVVLVDTALRLQDQDCFV